MNTKCAFATCNSHPRPGPRPEPNSKWFVSLCTLSAVRPSGISVVNIRYAGMLATRHRFGFNLLSGPCFGLDQPTSFFNQPCLPTTNQVCRKSTRFHQNQPGLSKINQVYRKSTRFHQHQPGISAKNQKKRSNGGQKTRGAGGGGGGEAGGRGGKPRN